MVVVVVAAAAVVAVVVAAAAVVVVVVVLVAAVIAVVVVSPVVTISSSGSSVRHSHESMRYRFLRRPLSFCRSNLDLCLSRVRYRLTLLFHNIDGRSHCCQATPKQVSLCSPGTTKITSRRVASSGMFQYWMATFGAGTFSIFPSST